MLNLSEFKELPDARMFTRGVVENSENQLFMERHDIGRLIKWVAIKGLANDWAMYVLWDDENTWEDVVLHGDKIMDREQIQRLTNVTDEVMALYRH